MRYDDLILMAYADGELDASQSAEIAQAAANDPALAARVAEFRASRDAVAAAFATPAPVPAALQASVAALIAAQKAAEGGADNVVALTRRPAATVQRTVPFLAGGGRSHSPSGGRSGGRPDVVARRCAPGRAAERPRTAAMMPHWPGCRRVSGKPCLPAARWPPSAPSSPKTERCAASSNMTARRATRSCRLPAGRMMAGRSGWRLPPLKAMTAMRRPRRWGAGCLAGQHGRRCPDAGRRGSRRPGRTGLTCASQSTGRSPLASRRRTSTSARDRPVANSS